MQHAQHHPPADLSNYLNAFRGFVQTKRPGLPPSWLTDAVATEGWVATHGLPPIHPSAPLLQPLTTAIPIADPVEEVTADVTPVLLLDGTRRRVALVQETPAVPHLSWVRRQHPQLLLAATLLLGLVPVTQESWAAAEYTHNQIVISPSASERYPWLKVAAQLRWEAFAAELPDWLRSHGYTVVGTSPGTGPKHTEVTRFAVAEGGGFEVTRLLTTYGLRLTGKFIPPVGQGISVLGPIVESAAPRPEQVFPDEWFFALHRRVSGLQTIRL